MKRFFYFLLVGVCIGIGIGYLISIEKIRMDNHYRKGYIDAHEASEYFVMRYCRDVEFKNKGEIK